MTLAHSEVANRFADGRTGGAGRNMFIEGNTVYSYGHHFPIARRIGENEYLFNSRNPSFTTNTHRGLVYHALKYQNSPTLWFAPGLNVGEIAHEIRSKIAELSNKIMAARSRGPFYVAQFLELKARWSTSKKRFGLKNEELDQMFDLDSNPDLAVCMVAIEMRYGGHPYEISPLGGGIGL